MTLLAAGIAFFGASHMPNISQVAPQYTFGVLTAAAANGDDSDVPASPAAAGGAAPPAAPAGGLGSDEKFAKCDQIKLMKVQKMTHNNFGGAGPDQGEEGIVYEMGLYDVATGEETKEYVHVTNTTPYTSVKGDVWNGVHGKFMSLGISPNTSVGVKVEVWDTETEKAKEKFPGFSITFFDLDQEYYDVASEYIIAKDFAHYYVAADTQVAVSTEEGAVDPDAPDVPAPTVTKFQATEQGGGDDNPTESEALTPLMKNKGVTLSYRDTASAEFEIGASEGGTERAINFVMRPSLLCAKTIINGKEEDPLDTSIPGIKLPLMDGVTPALGLAMPDVEVER
jgi:hypothetical protein